MIMANEVDWFKKVAILTPQFLLFSEEKKKKKKRRKSKKKKSRKHAEDTESESDNSEGWFIFALLNSLNCFLLPVYCIIYRTAKSYTPACVNTFWVSRL